MSASRKAAFALAIGAVALVFAAAGCGGGDDDGSSGGTTTQATASGQNERLSQAEWSEYETVRGEAQAANTEAITTLKKCRKVLYGAGNDVKPSACFGDSLTNLTNTGKDTLDFLEAQQAKVGGACATANANLTGYVKLYVASAQTLDASVQREDVTGSKPTIENALVALENTKKASAEFTTACKPTGAA